LEPVRAELGSRLPYAPQAYGNEESVGRALRDSGVPRAEVFITTKFYPGHKDAESEAQRSLDRLGVDQVDLYIIHWPQGGPTVGLGGDGTCAQARLCALDRCLELQYG
jgi:diketogulonate reductase-like aldo/keto reductase